MAHKFSIGFINNHFDSDSCDFSTAQEVREFFEDKNEQVRELDYFTINGKKCVFCEQSREREFANTVCSIVEALEAA